jgi:citrate lyase subunit beta/citryl-CoA lyase
MRLRRSLLFVPGVTPERIAKAAVSRADGVILDLEDAVAPSQKVQARQWVTAALRRVDFGGRERIVRVNAIDTAEGVADLAAIVPLGPEALLLPKVRSAIDVSSVDAEVSRLEVTSGLAPGQVRLHLIIETVAGVLEVRRLAGASERVGGLFFGAGDFVRETRGRLSPGRLSELHALSEVLLAARATGLDAIDTPYFALGDTAGLEAHARFAADLGYDGKALIHPNQIDVVNAVFTPSAAAVDEARRIVTAYEAAESAGRGALALGSQFVDAVHVEMARTLLARAEAAGVTG